MKLHPKDLMSISMAAGQLGVSARRVQALIHAGRLPAQRLPGTSIWMIQVSDLDFVRVRKPGRPRKPTDLDARPRKRPQSK